VTGFPESKVFMASYLFLLVYPDFFRAF